MLEGARVAGALKQERKLRLASGSKPTPIAPRGMFFSLCHAVHHHLSAVAQSYCHVQRFLAKGSYRTFGKLCYFDHRSSRLGMILELL